MTVQLIVRVDSELKTQVHRLAKAEGKNVSEVVRDLLEGYVKDRDIGLYVDDLWRRIGSRLNTRGMQPEDIAKAIREVRSGKE
jgi:predicted DNA-binding protein